MAATDSIYGCNRLYIWLQLTLYMAATDADIHCSSGADIGGRVKKKREHDDEVEWNEYSLFYRALLQKRPII